MSHIFTLGFVAEVSVSNVEQYDSKGPYEQSGRYYFDSELSGDPSKAARISCREAC
jgi:hypothetical protein